MQLILKFAPYLYSLLLIAQGFFLHIPEVKTVTQERIERFLMALGLAIVVTCLFTTANSSGLYVLFHFFMLIIIGQAVFVSTLLMRRVNSNTHHYGSMRDRVMIDFNVMRLVGSVIAIIYLFVRLNW